MKGAKLAALARHRKLQPSLSLNLLAGVLDSRITFTRATSAWYFDSAGTLTDAGSGNARFDYDPTTAVWNYIRNNTMVGAAAGTPGTIPTNWVGNMLSSGGTTQTLGDIAPVNGIAFLGISVSGATPAASSPAMLFDAITQIAAVPAQVWTGSMYLSRASGSLVNGFSSFSLALREYDSGGVFLRQTLADVSAAPSAITRYSVTATMGASTAFLALALRSVFTGAAVAYDLRIGMPQLELAATAGPVVATSGTAAGGYATARGLLVEEQRSNLMLWSRDLTNAAWTTKTTITPLKDQIGIDRAANSASSLLATGNGATIAQTITQAATSSTLTFYLKRLIGTGTITIKQGATTLDVTASLNMSTWTRVTLNASVLNPAIGIVMATSGDKIAVDCGQFEVGAFATSPIPTTTAAVTRNADQAVISTLAPWWNASGGTLVVLGIWGGTGTAATRFVQFDDGTEGNRIAIIATSTAWRGLITTAGVSQYDVSSNTTTTSPFTVALRYGADSRAYARGTAGAASGVVVVPSVTTARLGASSTAVAGAIWVQRVQAYPRGLPDATLQALSQ